MMRGFFAAMILVALAYVLGFVAVGFAAAARHPT